MHGEIAQLVGNIAEAAKSDEKEKEKEKKKEKKKEKEKDAILKLMKCCRCSNALFACNLLLTLLYVTDRSKAKNMNCC